MNQNRPNHRWWRQPKTSGMQALCIGGLMVLCLLLPGLTSALDPEKELTQYTRTTWTDELPQTTVRAIHQTKDGYLWIGTYEGLARFDGVDFTIFDRSRTGDLPGTAIYHLREDSGGVLWVGTNGGLVRISPAGFLSFTTDDGLPSNLVYVTLRSDDGRVWVGTDRGLAVLDRKTFKMAAPGELINEALDLESDGDGALWIASDRGLFRLDGEELIRYGVEHGLPDEHCWALLRARDGSLWIGTDGGLVHYEDGQFTTISTQEGLPDRHVRAIFEDHNGSLWVGTEDSGLSRISGGRITTFGENDGLVQNHVRAIFEDREGSLWIGTNGGLVQFSDGKFTTFTTQEGLAHDFARVILEDDDGSIWIGTDGGGLNRFDDGRFEVFTTNDGLSSDSVRALCQTSDGALWIGTRSGLDRFKDNTFQAFTTDNGLSGNNIRAILEHSDGTLWVATESGGISLLSDEGITVLTTDDGLPSNRPRALYQDRHGSIWVGSYGGASQYKDGVFHTLSTADGLSNNIVFAFAEDEHGNLWIGTDGGLNLLRDGVITSYDRSVGLFDNTVFRILIDDLGHLWLSSNRGIARVSLDELYAFADGRIDKVEARGFNRSDGMKANQCNGVSQPAGWRTKDGQLWFPTVKGVVRVDPSDLHLNLHPPAVVFEQLLVNGEDTVSHHAATLANRSHLEIRYAALTFVAPQRIRFRYRLEGLNPEWIDAGSRRTAYFTNLTPGEYRFQVIACNADGVWNEQGASWSFSIPTPLHRTWWAFALYLIGGVLLIGTSVRLRLQVLAHQNLALETKVSERTSELAQSKGELEGKTRMLADQVHQLEISERRAVESERQAREASRAKSVFLSNMSHELRTPLNSIIGFASILVRNPESSPESRTQRFLGNILTSGEHLLDLINELLDLAKIEAGRMGFISAELKLSDVLDSVESIMHGVAAESAITIKMVIADDLPVITGDQGKIKQILFNLLSNAVKFSPRGSTVTVEVSSVAAVDSPLTTPTVRIDVIDHGIGVRREDQEIIFEEFRQVDGSSTRRYEGTGLGLALVRRLLEMHGGQVSLKSAPGEGSTFTVLLPVKILPAASLTIEGTTQQSEAAARANGKGRTILVVEDDPVSFHSLARELESEGYTVLGASTGEQALEMVDAAPPDLISLDIILPGLGGWDVLKELRARPRGRDIPVVIVTSMENRDLGTALGADDFFVKPVQRDAFISRVRELAPLHRDSSGPPAVLIVDDDQHLHEILSAELKSAGYHSISAMNGEEGVDLAIRHLPDLLILDLMMPGMSGFEVVFRLRAESSTRQIPIIVLSAKDLTQADRQVLSGKIVTHIAKGSDALPRLTTTIRQLLGNEKPRAQR